jgi:hypothetical protein
MFESLFQGSSSITSISTSPSLRLENVSYPFHATHFIKFSKKLVLDLHTHSRVYEA